MNAHLTIKLAAATLLALLPACSVLKPTEDPTRYFVLSDSPQTKLTSESEVSAIIGPVSIPAYLENKEIATIGTGRELILAEYHIWGESLDKAISQILASNVSRLLDSPAVAPYPAADFDFQYEVALVVRRFEMAADGKVRLEASYGIRQSSRSPIEPSAGSRNIVIAVENPNDYGSIADAMSKALNDLSKTLGREILNFHRKSEKAAAEAEAAETAALREEANVGIDAAGSDEAENE